MSLIIYGQFGPISSDSVRITETLDTRITQNNDTRITNTIDFNAGSSSILVNPTLIPYTKEAYYHYNGSWKPIEIFVKWDGNWTTNFIMYKNINGIWKRSY